MPQRPSADDLDALRAIVGPAGWLADPADWSPYAADWRGRMTGVPAAVLRPRTTDEAAQIVQYANTRRLALVPQGGNTGLVLGGIPDPTGSQILLSTDRMTAIRNIDAKGNSITVEAGCILRTVQEAARAHDRMFPLSLASEGSARIGGLISTNAGGVHVLRYGMMRAQVLGLEAVLPDGQMLNGLTALRKDNAGIDLKQLLIGAEGTLGLITAAVLRLWPAPRTRVTALMGLRNPQAAVALLGQLGAASGNQIDAFELMPRDAIDLVLQHIPGCRDPLEGRWPWYVLMEASSPQAECSLHVDIQAALEGALEGRLVGDATIAGSQAQAAALWQLREALPEAEKADGKAIKHDISVTVADVPQFLDEVIPALESRCIGGRVLAFGHLGDGNIHFNLRRPVDLPEADFFAQAEALTAFVHDQVVRYGGSIAAEHGVGRLRQAEVLRTADPARLAAVRAIKAAIDPNGIFNPDLILPARQS